MVTLSPRWKAVNKLETVKKDQTSFSYPFKEHDPGEDDSQLSRRPPRSLARPGCDRGLGGGEVGGLWGRLSSAEIHPSSTDMTGSWA